jgi:hypothetical protein
LLVEGSVSKLSASFGCSSNRCDISTQLGFSACRSSNSLGVVELEDMLSGSVLKLLLVLVLWLSWSILGFLDATTMTEISEIIRNCVTENKRRARERLLGLSKNDAHKVDSQGELTGLRRH